MNKNILTIDGLFAGIGELEFGYQKEFGDDFFQIKI
jgi:hypothetical protein